MIIKTNEMFAKNNNSKIVQSDHVFQAEKKKKINRYLPPEFVKKPKFSLFWEKKTQFIYEN